jgi:DNA replicative helicase MCM subunit Mcm2 (Cdc46/Mcm family)
VAFHKYLDKYFLQFTIDKYAIHQEIDSKTTIIATTNPHTTYWKDSIRITNEEIPVARALLDRFDQIFAPLRYEL